MNRTKKLHAGLWAREDFAALWKHLDHEGLTPPLVTRMIIVLDVNDLNRVYYQCRAPSGLVDDPDVMAVLLGKDVIAPPVELRPSWWRRLWRWVIAPDVASGSKLRETTAKPATRSVPGVKPDGPPPPMPAAPRSNHVELTRPLPEPPLRQDNLSNEAVSEVALGYAAMSKSRQRKIERERAERDE